VKLPSDIVETLHATHFEGIIDAWEAIEEAHGHTDEIRAELGRVDRFYLLVNLLNRPDAFHSWLYARCREVEAATDGYLDLWAREHYKSTIITFAGIIQEILKDPEITIGIFSHTKPVARKFLIQIKQEFETNELLKHLYSDILWANPKTEALKWSEEKGITVKRQSNPKEATVEGHGLVDGMPTGAHFGLMVFDDVVTLESVGTPDQVKKTTKAWEIADNLGARNADGNIRKWHIGTRYSFGDTYADIIEKKVLKTRLHPATEDGTPGGKPVFLTPAAWDEKKKNQGPSTTACQMLLNPAAGNEAMFSKDNLQFVTIRPATLNVYITVDPARSQKKGSDNTVMLAQGVDAAGNVWLLDGWAHKMKLEERWMRMRDLRKYWLGVPGVQRVEVGYERYGLQSDIEYFELEMKRERNSWEVKELAWPNEGPGSKIDRIERLTPLFAKKKYFMAAELAEPSKEQLQAEKSGRGYLVFKPVKRRDHEGNIYSLNAMYLKEYMVYPFSAHDDVLDASSRIYDMEMSPPVIVNQADLQPEAFEDGI
jgi:hypothetical protein